MSKEKNVMLVLFLPKSRKWKMVSSKISVLSIRVLFHFHEFGRKSMSIAQRMSNDHVSPIVHQDFGCCPKPVCLSQGKVVKVRIIFPALDGMKCGKKSGESYLEPA